jgi:hypothetical protein
VIQEDSVSYTSEQHIEPEQKHAMAPVPIGITLGEVNLDEGTEVVTEEYTPSDIKHDTPVRIAPKPCLSCGEPSWRSEAYDLRSVMCLKCLSTESETRVSVETSRTNFSL